MATAQPTPDDSDSVVTAGAVFKQLRHRVKVKPAWTSAWQSADYLECLSFSEACAPTIPHAAFVYHAGRIKREDSNSFEDAPIIDLGNWFVRVELLSDERQAGPDEPDNETVVEVLHQWTGIFQQQNYLIGGLPSGGAPAPIDVQLIAQGLEQVLDMQPIRQAIIKKPQLNDYNTSVADVIPSTIPFNDRLAFGLSEVGNRSAGRYRWSFNTGTATWELLPETTANPDSFYVFDGTDTATTWSVYDAAEYLIKGIAPHQPRFVLTGQVDQLRNLLLPRFDPAGMTVKEALDQLISLRHGLCRSMRLPVAPAPVEGETPSAAPERPELRIVTVVGKATSFADTTLPANLNTTELDLDGRLDVVSSSVTYDDRASYGRIVVSGERLLVCAAFSVADSTLERAWTDTDETNYIGAAGSTNSEKDEARRVDSLKHVWQVFRVPRSWGFTTGDGVGGAKLNANPMVGSDASLDTAHQAPIRRGWGLTFQRNVPFFKPKYIVGFKPDWREAIVLLKDPSTNKFLQIDAIHGSVRLLDNDLGVDVGTFPAHLLAYNPSSPITISSQTQPKYNYRELIVVAAFRTDQRLQCAANVPAVKQANESDEDFAARSAALRDRVLEIEVPGAECWYVVPNTPTSLNAGALVPHAGGAIRNDRSVLHRVLAGAMGWYGKPRSAIDVSVRDQLRCPEVGTLVTRLIDGGQYAEVNSIVSSRSFDLTAGVTSLSTGFTELAFGARQASSALTLSQSRLRHG
jgi:hypothetical protein